MFTHEELAAQMLRERAAAEGVLARYKQKRNAMRGAPSESTLEGFVEVVTVRAVPSGDPRALGDDAEVVSAEEAVEKHADRTPHDERIAPCDGGVQ